MLKTTFVLCSLIFYLSIFAQPKDTSFALCGDKVTKPYYYPELNYEGGFWEVKQSFESNYPVKQFAALKNNSGIITIQFKVNCKGEVGQFTCRVCDLTYQPSSMHEDILGYFLDATMALDKWVPAQDENGEIVNSHKFFSFKIMEGQLLEILPK